MWTDFAFESYTQSTTGTAISTAEELAAIGQGDASAEYYLTNHIDLSTLSKTWTALFSEASPFTGTLHGNGYAVYNLEIAETSNYQGLFAAVSEATIENLAIAVKSISGNAVVGALAGYAAGTNLELGNIMVAALDNSTKIEATGSITLSSFSVAFVGGLVVTLHQEPW